MKEEIFLTKYIRRIPDRFYPRCAFGLLIALIFTMPLTYLVKAYSFHNIHQDLLITVETLMQLFVLLYALKLIVTKEISSIALPIWDKMLIGVLLFATISAFLAEDKEIAFMGTGYRCEGLTTYFCYAAIYICAKLVTNSRSQKILLYFFTGAISLLSTMTLIQSWPALKNMLGTIGNNLYGNGLTTAMFSAIFLNTNHYAYMLTLGILGAATLFLFSQKYVAILMLLLYGFNLWALIVNNTFGCYLAVILGLAFLLVLLLLRNKHLLKKWLVLVILFIGISFLCQSKDVGKISEDFTTLHNDIENLSENEYAGNGRLPLWKQGIFYISQKPIFGYGPEGLYHQYTNDGFEQDRPHNEYIQMAAFHGIPALCMYAGSLILLFIFCMKHLKKLSNEYICIGCMIFGYCISAFFGNTMYYTTPYFFLFLGMLSTCKNALRD